MSLNEVARRIGVSPQAARRAIERGEIPAFIWGRTYRVPRKRFEQAMLLCSDRGPLNEETKPD